MQDKIRQVIVFCELFKVVITPYCVILDEDKYPSVDHFANLLERIIAKILLSVQIDKLCLARFLVRYFLIVVRIVYREAFKEAIYLLQVYIVKASKG